MLVPRRLQFPAAAAYAVPAKEFEARPNERVLTTEQPIENKAKTIFPRQRTAMMDAVYGVFPTKFQNRDATETMAW